MGRPSRCVSCVRSGRRRDRRAARRETRPADRELADFFRCGDITLEQRRRQVADGGVVEPVAGRIARQQRRGVDVERKQIANRVAVFGAVQPAERIGAAGIWRGNGHGVQRGFQRGQRGRMRRFVGPPGALGRHLPRTQLADDLLPRVRMIAQIRRIDRVKLEPAGLYFAVVTRQAVCVHKRTVRRVSRWCGPLAFLLCAWNAHGANGQHGCGHPSKHPAFTRGRHAHRPQLL